MELSRETDLEIPISGEGDRLVAIELDTIEPNRYQPRRAFDVEALETLARSIESAGVIQPIVVRPAQPDSTKTWELIAGERRWRAARRAGLHTIPAIMTALSERESAEWALVENLQREDLDPIERADALKALADEFGLTHQQIAEQVALDRATVTNIIRLTDLEPEIRMLLASRTGESLSGGHGKALLGVEAGATRVALARQAVREGWSVRALERAIAEGRGTGEPETTPENGTKPTRTERSPELGALERQLAEHLGTKVRLEAKTDRSKGRIIIEFYGIEHFENVMTTLGIQFRS